MAMPVIPHISSSTRAKPRPHHFFEYLPSLFNTCYQPPTHSWAAFSTFLQFLSHTSSMSSVHLQQPPHSPHHPFPAPTAYNYSCGTYHILLCIASSFSLGISGLLPKL